jgi:hypothetical protein
MQFEKIFWDLHKIFGHMSWCRPCGFSF